MRNLDYVGKIFGAWEVLKKVQRGSRNSMWLCKCQCGTEKVIRSIELKNGRSKSCGCLKNKYLKDAFTKHGRSRGNGRYLYSTWIDMIRRCYDKRRPAYKYYGGRGITVCRRWRESFIDFMEDIGDRPTDKHSIDRINNNGNYEPDNCRWATSKEQANNRRPMSKNKQSSVIL